MQHCNATQSPARLLHFLAAITAIANDEEGVERALPKVLTLICTFIGSSVGHAFVVSSGSAEPTRLWHVEDPRRFVAFRQASESISFVVGQGLVGRVLGTRTAVWVEDVSRDPNFFRADAAKAAGLGSAFAFPVLAGSEVAAVLEFYATTPTDRDDELLSLMQTVGIQLGRMIERARAAEAMRVEHARQRLFFETSSDAVFVADATARITDANPAACRMLGCRVDELIGKSPAAFAAPEWVDVVEQSVEAKLKGEGVSSRYEYVVVDSAGNRIPVEVTSTALRDGDSVLGVHALMRDLREHRRAERALRESEERFRGAFEAAPIGMGLTSPDGRWLKVNEALCRMIGYTSRELLTMRWHEITHQDDFAEDLAFGKRLLGGEISSYQLEKRYLRKDGSVVWIHLSISLVRDDDGSPAYSVAQILDIDERKRRELEATDLRSRHPISGSLSPREREILGLLAEGKTSAEVGIQLGIAEETVQTHVRRSMAKLDARSRTQAVASAIRLGWLGDDHPSPA